MLSSIWSKAARPKSFSHFAGATATCTTTTCAATGTCQTFRPNIPQRRKSSSKSSNAQKSEIRPLTATPSHPAGKDAISEASAPARKRSTPKFSRPRSKPAVEEAGASRSNEKLDLMPAVPSTQHLHPHDIHVASFFSIHRPISVTSAVPAELSPDDFSQIFSTNPKPRMADVIATLSSVVSTLEKGSSHDSNSPHSLQQQRQHSIPSETDSDDAVVKAANLPNSTNPHNTSIHIVEIEHQEPGVTVQAFPKSFKHFVPPPPPIPQPEYDNLSAQTRQHQRQAHSRHLGSRQLAMRQQSATYQPNAVAKITHPLPPPPSIPHFFNPSTPSPVEAILATYLPSNSKQPFLRRMWLRQLLWEAQSTLRTILAANNGNLDMLRGEQGGMTTGMVIQSGSNLAREIFRCISTKRQRKLKMKKHKYKKLMKRTRNLRRKLDKL